MAISVPTTYAKEFVIQNESVNQFVVNGSNGNIILNPNSGFGNVGIGTSSPQNKLEVIGAVTVAGTLNASSLNVTGFSITDDSLVSVVEFDEKEKTEFPNQIQRAEPVISPRLKAIKTNSYINVAVSGDEKSRAGVAQSGTATDSESVSVHDLRVRNLGLESNSECPSSSTQKSSEYKIKKVKIKDIKAGDYVLSLDESTGKLVPRKVNALLDHGIKPIYELTTMPYRAINTTGEHPYLVKLYGKKECDKYSGNVWNKEPDNFNGYCTRWVEVKYLAEGDYITVPKIESDLNNDGNQMQKWKGHVAQRIEPLFDSRGDVGSSIIRKSRRAHTDLINKIEKEEKQAHSLNKALVRLTRISHEFFLDSEKLRNTHTVKDNKDSDYLNFSENKEIIWVKITSIKTLEPQHVYDLSIEGTRNFIANDIVAHNTYLATSSGNVGIGTTSPSDILEVIGNVRVSGSLNASSINTTGAVAFATTAGNSSFGSTSSIRPARLSVYNSELSSDAFTIIQTQTSGAQTNSPFRIYAYSNGDVPEVLRIAFPTGAGAPTGASLQLLDAPNQKTGSVTVQITSALGSNSYINNSGFFGINTSSPAETLDVLGTLNIRPKGTSALYVNPSGNVGINTTTPAQTLTVQGTLNVTPPNTTGFQNNVLTGGALFVGSNGNVGIGTKERDETLTVYGNMSVGVYQQAKSIIFDMSVSGSLRPYGDKGTDLGAASTRWSQLYINTINGIEGTVNVNTNGNGIHFYGQDPNLVFNGSGAGGISFKESTTGIKRFWIQTDSTNTGNISFASTSSATPNMIIRESGNVGINTTTPAQTLQVLGTLNITAQNTRSGDLFVASSGNVGIGTTSPTDKLTINGGRLNITQTNADFIRLDRTTNVGTDDAVYTGVGSVTTSNTDDYYYIGTDSNRFFKIMADGGFTSISNGATTAGDMPNFRLDVQGTINASGLLLTNNTFSITQSGNVGIGIANPTSTLHVIGTGNFSGNLYAGSCTNQTSPLNQTCTDIAELFSVENGIEAGEVVCLKENGKAGHCDKAFDSKILGVISTNPAIVIEGGDILLGKGEYSNKEKMPIALKGKVPVKADCTVPIKQGDLLVASSKKGYAQNFRASKISNFEDVANIWGSDLGKALEDCKNGQKMIMAWVG